MNSNLALRIAVVAASSLVGSLGGCDVKQGGDTDGRKLGGTVEQAGRGVEARMHDGRARGASNLADSTITARIKAVYVEEPQLQFQHINVDTVNGIAILSGAVASQASSDRAEQLASMIEGVRSIDNRLMIGSIA